MNSFIRMAEKYSTRNADKLRKVLEPLRVHFGIEYFHYHRVNNDGAFEMLTYPDDLALFFYSSDFYMYSPYQVHPSRVEGGFSIWNRQNFQGTDEVSHFLMRYHGCTDLPTYIEKDSEGYSSFSWAVSSHHKDAYLLILHNFNLMRDFFSIINKKFRRWIKHCVITALI